MSGFAGIVNLDGAPVDRALLSRFEDFLHDRGPDGQGIWAEGNAGLVHTLLRATDKARGEHQPMSLDRRVWIVADARIDDRENLVRELAARGRDVSLARPDAELILHAYAEWGEECVDHLLGDFAFAIWDAPKHKLFCARDHFGVRPFFYAQIGKALVFSNMIDCPRLHPGLQWEIYEPAIADFLILGYNHDVQRTAIAPIRRLAPAHALAVADGEVRTRRFWTLPADSPTVFHRSRDYAERFLDLFEQAVTDRLRTNRAAVLMSGGLDSSSVAAMGKRVLAKRPGSFEISAHTGTYASLIPYDEGRYARLAAEDLGIAWHGFPLDEMRLFENWNNSEMRSAEPERMRIFPWKMTDLLGNPRPGVAVLTGQGSDALFGSYRKQHCRRLAEQGRWWQLAKDVGRYLGAEGRFQRLYLRGHLRKRLGKAPPRRPFPEWLNPDLERRLNLKERYEQFERPVTGRLAPAGAVRPEAYEAMSAPLWPTIFEDYAPDSLGAPLEVSHPFFDLRLVRYVLSLPALPWCSDKELLRRSMKGLLPDEIRLRSKSPVSADYLKEHYRISPKPWLDALKPAKELNRFVNADRARACLENLREWETVVHLRPISLNYWLHWESQFTYNLPKEESRAKAG